MAGRPPQGRGEVVVTEHGTISRYTNGRCRCKKCRAARTEYDARRRIAERRLRDAHPAEYRYYLAKALHASDPTLVQRTRSTAAEPHVVGQAARAFRGPTSTLKAGSVTASRKGAPGTPGTPRTA